MLRWVSKDVRGHATMSSLKEDRTFKQPVNWTTTGFMLAFHIGAIAALFMFSWKGLAVALFLWWLTGSL